MLKEFKVRGFKNFKEELFFNLGDTRNYEFNSNAVKNGVVKTSLIYGMNGSGKSNLGYAIFDIIGHLTDKRRDPEKYKLYLNLEKDTDAAEFYYKFQFDKNVVEYQYSKKNYEELICETVKINGKIVINYDYRAEKETIVSLPGAENLKTTLNDNKISFVKYLIRNTNLDKRKKDNKLFGDFLDFVDRMLFFRSLEQNEYLGYKSGIGHIHNEIIKENKLQDFQNFLSKNKLNYKLLAEHRGDQDIIVCEFPTGKKADFFDLSSKGTRTLTLFYYWSMFLKSVSFVFIDEFDAFYHFEISKLVVEFLRDNKNLQVILTTHNTDGMNNDLLRPDCYFILNENKISSLADATEKELRCAHNLQKMYKAGAFKV